jgi:hypothetical protein
MLRSGKKVVGVFVRVFVRRFIYLDRGYLS